MAPASIEIALATLVAELARTAHVDFDRRMSEQGIDSLQHIVLRERLEMDLGAIFSDEEWMSLDTPASILACLQRRTAEAVAGLAPRTAVSASQLPVRELEIGMPLTGRNNLAETPLLQYLGDLRWRDISGILGVPTREIVDDQGERLYATFFYVEVAFSPDRPMSAFGENDRFRVFSTLARYGTSMLDGTYYLVPLNGRDRVDTVAGAPFSSLPEAVAAGVPAVRLSNIFVRQFAGAEWLKKGRPADPRFGEIPSLPAPPDSYVTTKEAERSGRFDSCGARAIPMTDGPVTREYRLIPDRDLNGAGLVYFANYPMFLDICERDVLLSARRPLSEAAVDSRTIIHRRSAYVNNASSGDTLRIEIEPWICESRAPTRRADDAPADLDLHINCCMYRRSDGRLMMVSTARKRVTAVSSADTAISPP